MATYEVTSPDGAVYEIEGPEGADPSQLIAQIGGVSPSSPEAPQESASMGDQIARQLGLTGRAVVEGISGLAALPSDALFGAINGIYQMRGEQPPFTLASESIRQGLTDAGVPTPETGTEKFAGGVMSALSGAGTAVGVGRGMMGAAIPKPAGAVTHSPIAAPASMTEAVGNVLASNVAGQAAGAVAGTTAQRGAAALGAPVPVQIAAGLAGGAVAGALAPVPAAAGRGTAALAEPVRESGRRAIAGRVLNTAASDARRAVDNLDDAAVLVKGSLPTAGEAARDVGLAWFQQRLRGIGDSRFNVRASQQNEARQTLLDSVAQGGTPRAIQQLTQHREDVTRPLRITAFAQAKGKAVDTAAIASRIDDLLADPENAGRSVQMALKSIREQIAPEGAPPLTDARALYAVRKEINRILEGKYVGADESVLRYAGGQLGKVKDFIDDGISAIAPDWKAYLTKYAQLSKPIDRAETVGTIRARTDVAAPDIRTGRDVLSQAKWKSVVARALPDLEDTLTKGQVEKMKMIGSDLDRGAAAISAGKVSGSDTAANLAASGQISVANVVGRVIGKPIRDLSAGTKTLTRPLAFIYKLPDEAIRELLVEAMLDPKLAAALMKEGTPQNVRAFADAIAESSRAATVGAASGAAVQQGAR